METQRCQVQCSAVGVERKRRAREGRAREQTLARARRVGRTRTTAPHHAPTPYNDVLGCAAARRPARVCAVLGYGGVGVQGRPRVVPFSLYSPSPPLSSPLAPRSKYVRGGSRRRGGSQRSQDDGTHLGVWWRGDRHRCNDNCARRAPPCADAEATRRSVEEARGREGAERGAAECG